MLLATALLSGMALGGLGVLGKELFFGDSDKSTENPIDKISSDEWEKLWLYNKVSIHVDKDDIRTPFLLGVCKLGDNGARYLFRVPFGITSDSMRRCIGEIKEKFNINEVDIKPYKDDMVTVELRNVEPENIFKGSIANEKWKELWDAIKIKTGDASEGYSYPILIGEVDTEYGKDYIFQLPIGLSTFEVNKKDIAIREFLSARNIKITSINGNQMKLMSITKELPSQVKYQYIEREKRDELEVVIGKCLGGWKRLRLLGGLHNVFIGGAVGTGKSVATNGIITDSALAYPPSELEMWLVDLKVVELAHFQKLKHVKRYGETVEDLMNMIDDLTEIMWDRYDKMKKLGVKKLSAYNELVDEKDKLPHILFVIEEMYEFTTSKIATKGDNNYVEKLAVLLSKCRTSGICCICTTQRLVNAYIPRNISANLMNRLCFKVSDSKESALLTDDRYDATRLNGKGHGCLIDNDIEEFQGFFIDEDKKEVTNLLKQHNLLREDENNEIQQSN